MEKESDVKEGQVIRFGGREDGSADFRASKESVLIALTACGEKHAAFKTQALTCGLDVIGDYLTEINVTSPTCIRELDAAFGIDIAGLLMDAIEARLRG